MNRPNNLANYQAEFASFLKENKYSVYSVKSNLEDLDSFFKWAVRTIRPFKIGLSRRSTLLAYFSFGAIQQYFDFHQRNSSVGDFLRHVITIQSYIKFAVSRKWLSNKILVQTQKLADEYESLLNRNQKIVRQFAQFLAKSTASKNTLRSYLTDIKEYLVIN